MDMYNVGRIVNTHGINGEIRVLSTTDFPEERFKEGSKLYVYPKNKKPLPVVITTQRKHKNFYLLSFEDYPTVESVEEFKDGLLKVRKDQQGKLPENEYYLHEIVGLTVVDESGKKLGKIKEVLMPGANDVWVVSRLNKSDLLLPYTEEVILDVDLKNEIVTAHLLEGLEDL